MKVFALYLGLLLVGLGVACQCPPYKPFKPVEVLYQASPLTMLNSFTAGIEGPACDRTGNIFAVNFGKGGLHSKPFIDLIYREIFLLDIGLVRYKGHAACIIA